MHSSGAVCLVIILFSLFSCAEPDPAFKEVNSTRTSEKFSEYDAQASYSNKNSENTIDESILNQGGSASLPSSDFKNGSEGFSHDQDHRSVQNMPIDHDQPDSHNSRDGYEEPTNNQPSEGDEDTSKRDEDPGHPEEHEDSSEEQGVREIVARFPLLETESHIVRLDPHTSIESVDFHLSHQKISEKKSYQQITRDWKSVHFQQRTSQGKREDLFKQNGARKVDILIVVDNSESMKKEQKELAKRMAPLLSKIKGHDWKIAVTTTDPKDPCVRDVFDHQTPNFEGRFISAIQAGTKGTKKEQGFRTAVRALSSSCLSSPWLRKQSQLSVIFISDEDNCSNGNQCPRKKYGNVDYLLNELNRYRTPQRDAKVYGLIWDPAVSKKLCPNGYHKGHQYSQAIARTGGHMGSICDNNYSDFLTSVSGDIKSNLERVYSLSSIPIENSVRVFIDGHETQTGYSVSHNILEFKQAPNAGSEIHVMYHSYEEAMKTFEFPQAIEPLTATVLVDGALVKTGVHMSDSHLEFEEAPRVGSEIRVLYQSPDDLMKSFAIGTHLIKDSLHIEFSDFSKPDFSYDEQSGSLSFDPVLKDGTKFTVEFESYHYTEEMTYDFDLSRTIEVIQAEDHTTGESIPVVYQNGQFIFTTPYTMKNHPMTVIYRIQKRGENHIVLSSDFMTETIAIQSSQGHECFNSHWFFIDEMTIDVSHCGFEEDDSITVMFDSIKGTPTVFHLEEVGDLSLFEWSVLIDGQPVDFEREGKTFTLLDVPFSRNDVVIRGIYAEKD